MTSTIPGHEPGGKLVSIGDTQPMLVLAGRHERTCVVEGAEAMAKRLPNARLVLFEHSGHMTSVEENERYLAVVRDFLP